MREVKNIVRRRVVAEVLVYGVVVGVRHSVATKTYLGLPKIISILNGKAVFRAYIYFSMVAPQPTIDGIIGHH